jgi:hypothetical protein
MVMMLSSMCSNTIPWGRNMEGIVYGRDVVFYVFQYDSLGKKHGRNRICGRDVVFYVFQYDSLGKKHGRNRIWS